MVRAQPRPKALRLNNFLDLGRMIASNTPAQVSRVTIPLRHALDGRIAQLVEQRIENPRVGGSIPPPATTLLTLQRVSPHSKQDSFHRFIHAKKNVVRWTFIHGICGKLHYLPENFAFIARIVFILLLPFPLVAAENSAVQQTLPQLLFPADFIAQKSLQQYGEATSVPQLTENINRLKQDYLEVLDNTIAFQGLYLSGNYEEDLKNNSREFRYGLEWELYDNGRSDAQRILGKRKLESRLQFLQQLRQAYARRKDSRISEIKQIEDRLALYIARLQSRIVTPQLKKAALQLKGGFITQVEYSEWELKDFRIKSRINYLQQKKFSRMDAKLINILNQIDGLKLKNNALLFATAEKNSLALKIQKLLSSRSEFLPRWEDNLSLRLYAEQQHTASNQINDVVGVRLKVPLDVNINRQKMIGMDRKIYADQAAAIKMRLQQKLSELMDRFQYLQQQVKYLARQYQLFNRRIESLQAQKKAGLPTLSHTPGKDLPLQRLNRLDIMKQALQTRLDLYRTLIELQELVLPEKFNDLFESH